MFDSHGAFADEITQFSASINQWQSRYDLSPDEFRFFAEVLVGYVAERLDEIDAPPRPIGRYLDDLMPRLAPITGRVQQGLAGRVEQAGLAGSIIVTRTPGSTVADWRHLGAWFIARPGTPSRIQRLGRDAIAAIRTLTLNLTRLSRVGIGASSRRADFLRLASIFHHADTNTVSQLGVAALGLHTAQHLGVVAEDSLDPVNTSTSWRTAQHAPVPISIHERGDTATAVVRRPLLTAPPNRNLFAGVVKPNGHKLRKASMSSYSRLEPSTGLRSPNPPCKDFSISWARLTRLGRRCPRRSIPTAI